MNCTEKQESILTLCGGLFICAHQRSCAFVNLQKENPTLTYKKDLEVRAFDLTLIYRFLTLMPTTMPFSLTTWGKSLPLLDFW